MDEVLAAVIQLYLADIIEQLWRSSLYATEAKKFEGSIQTQ